MNKLETVNVQLPFRFSEYMKGKTKDNLAYLGTGLVLAGALTFYVFYTDSKMGRIPDIPGPILWGMLSTPVVIGLILEQFWQHRRNQSLWLLLAFAALANISFTAISYFIHWDPPVLVWALITIFLAVILLRVAEVIVTRSRGARPRRSP